MGTSSIGYNSKYTGKTIDNILSSVERITAGADNKITLKTLSEGITQNSINLTQMQPLLDNKVSKDGDIISGTLYITDELIVPVINTTNSTYQKININNESDFIGYKQAKGKIYKQTYENNITAYIEVETYDSTISEYYIAGNVTQPLKLDTLNVGVEFGTNGKTKIKNDRVYGAIWNDYAECRQSEESEPGRVIYADNIGIMRKAYKRLQPMAEIISDTYGFVIGETEKFTIPVAVSGRVLAYPCEKISKFKIGDPVCSGPNGTVSKMSRIETILYPDRMIGVVAEIPQYEIWENKIDVKGRIWIKIK